MVVSYSHGSVAYVGPNVSVITVLLLFTKTTASGAAVREMRRFGSRVCISFALEVPMVIRLSSVVPIIGLGCGQYSA